MRAALRILPLLMLATTLGTWATLTSCDAPMPESMGEEEAPLPDRKYPDAAAGDATTPNEEAPPSDASADADADAGRPLLVFLGSTTTNGNIGGVTGADALCNALATDAGFGGTWTAWISVEDGPHAIDRLTSTGPWFLPSGEMVVASKTALTSGVLAHAIDHDEKAMRYPTPVRVWTGSGIDGRYSQNDCDKWRGGNEGRAGNSSATNATWTNASSDGCGNLGRLYCFER